MLTHPKELLDEDDLGEGHVSAADRQTAQRALVPGVLVGVVALVRELTQLTQVAVLLLYNIQVRLYNINTILYSVRLDLERHS